MANENLVIVESPAKAKTIGKYLGKGFVVKACMGHLRDLPKSTLGVDIGNDFEPEYGPIKGKEEIIRDLRRYAEALEHSPGDRRLWLLAVAAMEFHGEPERALETELEGLERFPNDASLMIHAGDVCRTLKRYEQAFSWWQRALETDSSHLDAVYSTGFCHEELGNWEKAHRVWTELTRKLDSRGQVIERAFPASRAEICMRKMGEIIET